MIPSPCHSPSSHECLCLFFARSQGPTLASPMASSTSSDPSSDYTRLLHGDQGYLLALAVTVLVILVATFIAKLYFSWRRFRLMKTAASTDHAALASDAMWLLGHVRGREPHDACVALTENMIVGRFCLHWPPHFDAQRTDRERLELHYQRATSISRQRV